MQITPILPSYRSKAYEQQRRKYPSLPRSSGSHCAGYDDLSRSGSVSRNGFHLAATSQQPPAKEQQSCEQQNKSQQQQNTAAAATPSVILTISTEGRMRAISHQFSAGLMPPSEPFGESAERERKARQ